LARDEAKGKVTMDGLSRVPGFHPVLSTIGRDREP
jgi:hypothetical protein